MLNFYTHFYMDLQRFLGENGERYSEMKAKVYIAQIIILLPRSTAFPNGDMWLTGFGKMSNKLP